MLVRVRQRIRGKWLLERHCNVADAYGIVRFAKVMAFHFRTVTAWLLAYFDSSVMDLTARCCPGPTYGRHVTLDMQLDDEAFCFYNLCP